MKILRHRTQRAATMVEFLIVAPIILLIGLGVVQIGLVFHAKSGLNFALQEAARMGAVSNASIESIEDGLVRGLVPYMGGSDSPQDFIAQQARVRAEFIRGTASGWIRVRQISPTPQSFADWAENSFDESGRQVNEIPNASLAVLRCTRPPSSGIAATKTSTACPNGGEPIGATSQQTLADANLLKLEMNYGVRLSVPIVSRIVGRALSMAAGCLMPENQQIGPLNLGTPQPSAANTIACASYNAIGLNGDPEPRIPVNLAITVRMQSPARRAGSSGWFTVANRGRDANSGGVQLGNGRVDAASQFAPIPVSQLNPDGVPLQSDQLVGTGNGSLHFGADTDWTVGGGGGGNCPPNSCCLPPQPSG